MEPIKHFRGEHYFLSNFSNSPITINFEGVDYTMATGEHIFHAMKIAVAQIENINKHHYLQALVDQPKPNSAKYLGRSIRIDVAHWNQMSEACMRRTQILKYSQNPELAAQLKATGIAELVETTTWGDRLWGVDPQGNGQNKLGKILMELRTKL